MRFSSGILYYPQREKTFEYLEEEGKIKIRGRDYRLEAHQKITTRWSEIHVEIDVKGKL